MEDREVEITIDKATGLIKYYLAVGKMQNFDRRLNKWVDRWSTNCNNLFLSKEECEKDLAQYYKTAEDLSRYIIISFYLPAP